MKNEKWEFEIISQSRPLFFFFFWGQFWRIVRARQGLNFSKLPFIILHTPVILVTQKAQALIFTHMSHHFETTRTHERHRSSAGWLAFCPSVAITSRYRHFSHQMWSSNTLCIFFVSDILFLKPRGRWKYLTSLLTFRVQAPHALIQTLCAHRRRGVQVIVVRVLLLQIR